MGKGRLEHCEPPLWGVVDEERPELRGEPDAPGRSRGELLAGDEAVKAQPAPRKGFSLFAAQKRTE